MKLPAALRQRPRLSTVLLGLAAVLSLLAIYGGPLREHLKSSSDPYFFNDDARVQIYPFDHSRDPQLFPDDYIARYSVACMATGYRAVYELGSLFADPRTISKGLPYVLLLVIVVALGIGALRFGRIAAAWVAVALCLSTDVFFERMGGGLPRAFAFPILACAAAALIHGRMLALAVITAVGAAFYPAAAVPGGIALAVVLLVLPASDRGSAEAWPRRRRLLTVAGTVLAAALFLLPTTLAMRKYGGYIRPADIGAYPEGGAGGRFYAGDRPPFKAMGTSIVEEATRALTGGGEPWSTLLDDEATGPAGRAKNREATIYALMGMVLVAFVRSSFQDVAARRLAMLLVAALAGHLLAKQVVPYFYLPQRYIGYPLPILLMLMIPAGAHGLLAGTGRFDRPWLRGASVLASGLFCLLLVGGRGSSSAGLTIHLDPRTKMYPFLETLPKDAMIAGWPNGSLMDNVPYMSRRQAFATFETHVAFQKGFVEAMRKRMRALIDAYFATDERALASLRDDFGVTHLIIDTRHYQKAPDYFRPFDRWIRDTYAKNQPLGFEVPKIQQAASVFQEGTLMVLDLRKLPAR